MAQNYEIDIKRYNGTDFDTLLPTPASHASTHQANGSDPITMQTGNYGDGTVIKAKLADGATYTTLTVTLVSTGWSDNSQTVTANGVTTVNAVISAPTPDSYDIFGYSGIRCTAQGNNSLTFVCESVPDVDLMVNILIPT